MQSIFYHCLNNVGKKSANNVGPQQGHNNNVNDK